MHLASNQENRVRYPDARPFLRDVPAAVFEAVDMKQRVGSQEVRFLHLAPLNPNQEVIMKTEYNAEELPFHRGHKQTSQRLSIRNERQTWRPHRRR